MYKDLRMGRRRAIIVAIVMGVIGVVFIAALHAAAPTASVQPEDGSKTANIGAVVDTTASGGQAIKFGTSSSTSSCPHRFPTPDCVGLPAGWTSTATYTSDLNVNTDNAIIENITMDNAVINVNADNVTIRKVKFTHSAGISTCGANTVIEDSKFTADGTEWLADGLDATIETGGYTARRIYMDGVYEGLRVGGRFEGCGDVHIEKSYVRASYPVLCPTTPGWDWHGDALQFYDGSYSSVTDSVILLNSNTSGINDCGGTSPYFLANQCNTGRDGTPAWTTVPCDDALFQPWYSNTLAAHGGIMADVNGLVVGGGGYPFRTYMPTRVNDLYIQNNAWIYGPRDAECGLVTSGWDTHLATMDANGQPVQGAAVSCN